MAPQHTTDDRIHVDYSRISLDQSGTGDGVSSQHDDNVDFAAEDGRDITRSYADNDVSAFSGAPRKDYERLLSDIRLNTIASVTIWHANRLHRQVVEADAFMQLCIEMNVRVYSYSRGAEYNFRRHQGRQDFLEDTLKAQGESGHRGDRVALARRRQGRNGTYGGGRRPYGWGVDSGRVRSVCVNPKAPPLERVYEERPVLDMTQHNIEERDEIRRWADDLDDGVKLNQILLDLKKRGVLTVSQKAGKTLRRGGRDVEHQGWTSKVIRGILTHPRVSGHSVHKGEIVKWNAWPEIISEERRQNFIELFSDPARRVSPGNTPRWFASRIAECAEHPESTHAVGRKSGGKLAYKCFEGGHCYHDAESLDRYLEFCVIDRLSRPDLADLVKAKPDVDVPKLRAEKATLRTRKSEAAMAFANGEIDAAQLATISTVVEAQISEIDGKLSESTSHSPLSPFVGAENAAQLWDTLSLGRRREILRLLFRVVLYPLGRGRGKRHAWDGVEVLDAA
ncbi:recombinase family protein [Nocardiopsis sediminis]|uniref:Recombinase family protein n=1 Tax=Nocardiopsis sediminis TaxID=1778267 RepID=A0ABV8FS73_9ACTN